MMRSAVSGVLRAGKHIATIVYPWLSDRLYLIVYTFRSNLQATFDPSGAVGGNWDVVGNVYFRVLKEQGLKPHHTFLDFGCGSLRIGRHVIAYLDAGHYVGVDMAANVLKAGEAVIRQDGLETKRPRLILSRGEVDFSFFDGRFDYVFATSVFTHLRPHMIEECLSNVHRVMHSGSVFYFTFLEGETHTGTRAEQPFSFYEEIAERHSLVLTRHEEYDREELGQNLASVRLRGSPA